MTIIDNEAIKEIRAAATAAGLTFTKNGTKINGAALWCFVDKRRGDIALNNCHFWTAYENVVSGYISSFDKETGYFPGVNHYKQPAPRRQIWNTPNRTTTEQTT